MVIYHALFLFKTLIFNFQEIFNFKTTTMTTFEEKKEILNNVFSPTAPIKEESFFRGRIEQLKRIVLSRMFS
jgi:hypothetical protein